MPSPGVFVLTALDGRGNLVNHSLDWICRPIIFGGVMHKDRFILALLLCAFFMLGACDEENENRDDRELPDRAVASSPLLRAYYNMLTFPEDMRPLKIPERGLNDSKEEITVTFEIGGAAVVTSVHTHLYVVPADGKSLQDSELVVRCISPNRTTSAWETLDIQHGDVFDPQAQVAFLHEFDGESSNGTWKIQIKDHVQDEDGRCLFRNGSLHINRGEVAGLGGANSETQTLDINTGNYDTFPEVKGVRAPADVGRFGVNATLQNTFTFISSFFVRAFTLTLATYEYAGSEGAINGHWLLVSPTGNWILGRLPDTPTESVDLGGSLTHNLYSFGVGDTGGTSDLLMNLNGEPSAGVWTLMLFDTGVDGNRIVLTDDDPDTMLPDQPELSLTLLGVS